MDWPFWVGSAIFAVTVGGLLFLRNRPLRDAQGIIVDDIGRPVARLSNDAKIILSTLYGSGESLSGYDIRRYVTMARQDFYALIADLEHRELVTNEVVLSGTHNVRRYYLTPNGYALFENDQNAA